MRSLIECRIVRREFPLDIVGDSETILALLEDVAAVSGNVRAPDK